MLVALNDIGAKAWVTVYHDNEEFQYRLKKAVIVNLAFPACSSEIICLAISLGMDSEIETTRPRVCRVAVVYERP